MFYFLISQNKHVWKKRVQVDYNSYFFKGLGQKKHQPRNRFPPGLLYPLPAGTFESMIFLSPLGEISW